MNATWPPLPQDKRPERPGFGQKSLLRVPRDSNPRGRLKSDDGNVVVVKVYRTDASGVTIGRTKRKKRTKSTAVPPGPDMLDTVPQVPLPAVEEMLWPAWGERGRPVPAFQEVKRRNICSEKQVKETFRDFGRSKKKFIAEVERYLTEHARKDRGVTWAEMIGHSFREAWEIEEEEQYVDLDELRRAALADIRDHREDER